MLKLRKLKIRAAGRFATTSALTLFLGALMPAQTQNAVDGRCRRYSAASVAMLAEGAKEELLKLSESKDGWKTLVSIVLHGKPGDPLPPRSVAFNLFSNEAGYSLRLDLHLRLDEASDVLVARSELTNLGTTVLDVQWLAAATLPLPASALQASCW